MKFFHSALIALLPAVAAEGSTTIISQTWTVSAVIPDYEVAGYSNTQTIAAVGISEIQSVTVDLNFSGGWNGDLFAYLVHESGYSVLLNRPGRSTANPDGAASSGMTINLSDLAAADIHTAIQMSPGIVTGSFQPDGRTTDPLLAFDTDARTAMLSSFNGLNGNGSWTLFVADLSAGETSTLQSWTLNITAVPEPSSSLLGGLGLLFLFQRRRSASAPH